MSLFEKAKSALRAADVELPQAEHYARVDPELALVACAYFQAKMRGPSPLKGPGMLVRYCREPIQHGFKRTAQGWTPPEASARRLLDRGAGPGDARAAIEDAERAANNRRVQAYAAEEREEAAAAWAALPDDERAAIARAVAARDPRLQRVNPGEFDRRCRQWAKRLVRACADLGERASRWAALTDAQREAAEKLALTWPLLYGDPILRLATLLAAHDSLANTFAARRKA